MTTFIEADGGGSSNTLTVAATILRHAQLRVIEQPTSLSITAEDIARGYVDAPSAARLEIKSNSPSGFLLIFENVNEFVLQTRVNGLAGDATLGAGGVLAQPGRMAPHGALVRLGFRFVLAKDARPGVYPWPLQLSVMPL